MENNIENEKNEAFDFMSDLIDLGVGFFSSWQKDIDKNKALLKTNYDHIGKIVTCHLVIESLINKMCIRDRINDETSLRAKRSNLILMKDCFVSESSPEQAVFPRNDATPA